MRIADLIEKRLELLAEMVPNAKVIALLVNPGNSNSGWLLAGVQRYRTPTDCGGTSSMSTPGGKADATLAAFGPIAQTGAILAAATRSSPVGAGGRLFSV